MSNGKLVIAQRFMKLPAEKRKSFLKALKSKNLDFANLPIVQQQNGADSTLSYAQQRQWFLWKLDSKSTAYHIALGLRLRGDLNIDAFRDSIQELVSRHDVARTQFYANDLGLPEQRVVSELSVDVPCLDLRNIEHPEEAAEGYINDLINKPFDLQQDPLLRVSLFRVSDNEHLMVNVMHHIVSDHWSMQIVLAEFVQQYQAWMQGGVASLPEMPIQYSDYAIWQRNWMEAGEQERQLSYWTGLLGNEHPVLSLPTDFFRDPEVEYKAAEYGVNFPEELDKNLRSFARSKNMTPCMVFLTAFQILLFRYTGQESIRIGIPNANRHREETAGVIGFFVNTQVFPAQICGSTSFDNLLDQCKVITQGAQKHQDLPFDILVDALNLERSLGHNPLFQVMFNHLGHVGKKTHDIQGLEVSSLELDKGCAQFDLTLETQASYDGKLSAMFRYAKGLFKLDTIERLADRYISILNQMVLDSSVAIGEFDILSDQERQQLFTLGRGTEPEPSPDRTSILEVISAMGERYPNKAAVIEGDSELSYHQLEEQSNQLAQYLLAQGVKPEMHVGIALPRCVSLLVAYLGVLKAGAVYVPLDLSYPESRLAYLVDDSEMTHLLSDSDNVLGFAWSVPHHNIVSVLDSRSYNTKEPVDIKVSADNTAYVIYTSGSTGQPKGVQITRGAIAMHCKGIGQRYGMSETSREMIFMSFSFDGAHERWMTALSHGGSVILRGEDMWTVEETYNRLHHHAVTEVTFPPVYLKQLAEHANAVGNPPAVRTYCFGGDAMSRESFDLARHALKPKYFKNGYGPTETVVTPLLWDARSDTEIVEGYAPIGVPVGERTAYVLNQDLSLTLPGAIGELYLGGELGLARGYLRRPDLTADRFVANPFVSPDCRQGERLYRTGDLVRWNTEGQLEYLGRIDHQVKIRGFRIELGEIESQLLAQEGIKQAVVVADEGATGTRLVAYISLIAGSSLNNSTVRSVLGESLPDYMVPAVVMVLDALPVNNNGKIDRKALPDPVFESAIEYEAPIGGVEEDLAEIWKQVLGVDRVGRFDNFFELGGDSIISLKVISQARTKKMHLEVRQIFQCQTIQSLAEAISTQDSSALSQHTIKKLPEPSSVLSFAQQRQWFLWKLNPKSDAYHISGILRLIGDLNKGALEESFSYLVSRHTSLRTVFKEDDEGNSRQEVLPEAGFVLVYQDLTDLPEDVKETKTDRVVAELTKRPFDLTTGPLIRVGLLKCEKNEHLLVVVMHHIISDAWSMEIITRESMTSYYHLASGQPILLAPIDIDYSDYAQWQHDWFAAEEEKKQLDYWTSQLGDEHPALSLATDLPRRLDGVYTTSSHFVDLSPTLSSQLQQFSKDNGQTLFSVLLASWQLLLNRYSGQSDIRVGVPIANRHNAQTQDVVGFFINTQVMRTLITPDMLVSDVLGKVKEAVVGAQAYQDLPFEKLVDALQLDRDLGQQPLFQVMMSHRQEDDTSIISLTGLEIETVALSGQNTQFDLVLYTHEKSDNRIGFELTYASELFSKGRITEFAGFYVGILKGILSKSDEMVSEFIRLDAKTELDIIRQCSNENTHLYRNAIHDVIAQQSVISANEIALIFEGDSLTYSTLNKRSNQLSHYLISENVKPEDKVGIALDRSIEMVIGLLAIMKAGAAYVPIDPSLPVGRMEYIIDNSGLSLLLSHSHLFDRLPIINTVNNVVTIVELDRLDSHSYSDVNPDVALIPESVAYVIYTSGSTGQPKGVANTHKAIYNRLAWMQQAYQLTKNDNVLQKTPFGFDVSVWEFFWPLMYGAKLVVASPGVHQDPKKLIDLISEREISTLHFVPSMLQAFIAEVDAITCTSIKTIVCSGEALAAEVQSEALRKLPQAKLYNLYGPTEAAIDVTHWTCDGDAERSVPIGSPISDTSTLVLDSSLNIVPRGVVGELYLGGIGLARGYVNRADLTAERFIANPFSSTHFDGGERLYRTGDLARWNTNNQLEYLGRIDHQVKIRGFRIELGEIEAQLLAQRDIQEAVVVAGEGPSGTRLIAYISLIHESDIESETIKNVLSEEVPDYMVPTRIIVLENLPLSNNGKIDRKALPKVTFESTTAYAKPEGEVEERLAEIWKIVLDVGVVGRFDNFFDLGGDSIVSLRVISQARTKGLHVEVRDIFEHQTLEALAEVISQQDEGKLSTHTIDKLEEPSKLLSFAQQRQWFLWKLSPKSNAYHIPAILQLTGQLDIDALEKSFSNLIARHESLRTIFKEDEQGESWQEVLPETLFSIEHSDLREYKNDVLSEEFQEKQSGVISSLTHTPFDLGKGPLLRVGLLALSENKHQLVVVMHHIISDAWSMEIITRESMAHYYQLVSNTPRMTSPIDIRYSDYAAWQHDWFLGEEEKRQMDYWLAQLGDTHPVLSLPTDYPRTVEGVYTTQVLALDFPEDLSQQLNRYAKAESQTVFSLLLAGWQLLLNRYTGLDDIRVGVPIANRHHAQTQDLVGFFINTQVMRTVILPQMTVNDVRLSVKEAVLGAQAHQDLPFEKLVDALNLDRNLGQQPLFQVMMNHQRIRQDSAAGLPGLAVESIPLDGQNAQFDLVLNTQEKDGNQIGFEFTYAKELFSPETIALLAERYITVITTLIDDPHSLVCDCDLLSLKENERLMALGRGSDSCLNRTPIDDVISAMGEIYPHKSAVIEGDTELTYHQLEEQSNQLAHYLLAQGVKPEMHVGIALPRCISLLVAYLGVLKTGAAYVPLDLSYPESRLAYLVDDSEMAHLISDSDNVLGFAKSVPHHNIVSVISSYSHSQSQSYSVEKPVGINVSADNTAYVIYTSGSTGQPKGVQITRGAIAMHCKGIGQRYGMSETSREMIFMSFSFDGAHERWMTALSHGGSVILRGEEMWTVEETYNRLHHHAVTEVTFPPVYLKQLAEHANAIGNPPAVRTYCFGGDAMSRESFDLARHALKPKYFKNGYGPTETVVTPLLWDAGSDTEIVEGYAPIGVPVGERTAYVLNQDLSLTLPGAIGELYLGGELGLARGYLRRPDLTADRFVANPFVSSDCNQGERLYRTGDLVRWNTEGQLEYLGRIDHQVKIRGFRIELGEIESQLLAQKGIKQAVVIADEGPTGTRLVAYISLSHSSSLGNSSVRSVLGESLPDYMVPAVVMVLDALPVNNNGKIDRKALPEAVFESAAEYKDPEGTTEVDLAEIWKNVLGVDRVGRFDNFFELGGDSIISLQIVARMRQLGYLLTPRQMFEKQSIAELAAVLVRSEDVFDIEQDVSGEVDLLPIQQSFFATELTERSHWNQAVLLRSQDRLDIEAVQRAIEAVVELHDALRLRYSRLESGAWAQAYRDYNSELCRDYLWTNDVAIAGIEGICQEAQCSLDITQGPLMRVVAMQVEDGSARLFFAIHHLVIDGVSWRILLEDFQTAYYQLVNGQSITLPSKSSSYQQWAKEIAEYPTHYSHEYEYWKTLLGASNELPKDDTTISNPESKGKQTLGVQRITIGLDKEKTEALLQDVPAAYRTQINDVLLTALSRALHQWTGEPRVLIDLEGHGREDINARIDLSHTVGWFTSLFPLALDGRGTYAEGLTRVKEDLRSLPNKGVGFGAFKYYGSQEQKDTLALLPAAQVVFNYLGQMDNSFNEASLWQPAEEKTGNATALSTPLSHAVSINGGILGGELTLEITYHSDDFNQATVEFFGSLFTKELQELIAHCTSGVRGLTPSDVPLSKLDQGEIDALSLDVANIDDIYPLSPMQKGMLFHSLYAPEGTAYLNQLRLDMTDLDEEKFKAAWQQVGNRHGVLRTGFITDREEPLQYVAKSVEIHWRSLDWCNKTIDDLAVGHEVALAALAKSQLEQGLALEEPGLSRVIVIQLTDNTHHLIWTNHHLLSDGWSLSRQMGEVLMAYEGHTLPPVQSQYRDYIAWLEKQNHQENLIYWQQQVDLLDAPTYLSGALSDGKPVEQQSNVEQKSTVDKTYEEYAISLSEQDTERLQAFSQNNHVTVNTLVQGIWSLVISRYTGQDNVCFGATTSGRPTDLPFAEESLGMFINTIPVITEIKPGMEIRNWLQELQRISLNSRDYEYTPLYDIQKLAAKRMELGKEGLFDNILVFENYPIAETMKEVAPKKTQFAIRDIREETNFALTVLFSLAEGGTLNVGCKHDLSVISRKVIVKLFTQFTHGLMSLTQGETQYVSDVEFVTQEERAALYKNSINEHNFTYEKPIHACITEQATKTPEAIALIFENKALSYAELTTESNRLAHYLVSKGVRPEDSVGIAVERSVEMVVGLLAIIKTGAAYVPIDPALPSARMEYIIDNSGLTLLLSQSHIENTLPGKNKIPGVSVISLDTLDTQGHSKTDPEVALSCESAMYVIYTSGSTGQPKGVVNTHGALYNRLSWMQEAYGLTENDNVLQKTPFGFDVSVWEFFWPLMVGAKLVVASPGIHQEPQKLIDVINNNRITTLHFVPSMLQAFIVEPTVKSCESLKTIVCSGEALPAEVQADTLSRLPQANLYNLYGPTEAAIDVTHWTCNGDANSAVPIGRPISDTSTFVLDSALNIVPHGVVGELYLGGAGLARGYVNRPGLTAERFVANPFVDIESVVGDRLYRTGDLVRWNTENQLEYVGRIDHQVKIRGFRIELGEIESQILAHPEVREAVVVADTDGAGTRLVAYISLVKGSAINTDILKSILKDGLPEYMVPSIIIELDTLPLNNNGKIDRKLLPKAAFERANEYVVPVGEVEITLAGIWQTVLGIETVGRFDNFFELGGDSIISLQIVARVRQSGYLLTPRLMFEKQNIAELATGLVCSEDVFDIEQTVSGDVDLLPIQQAFFEKDMVERSHWNQAVLLSSLESLDPHAIRQAFDAIIEHHDVLRMNYQRLESGDWVQRYQEYSATQFDDGLWQKNVTLDGIEALCELAQSSLDIATGPLVRVVAMNVDDGSARLLFVIHHLVVDGVSWRILLEDFQVAYQQVVVKQSVGLPLKSSSYQRWAKEMLTYPAQNPEEFHYWQSLSGISAKLPKDVSFANDQQALTLADSRSIDVVLNAQETEALLQDVPAAYRTQINDVLLTALARALADWVGEPRVLIDVEGHGREDINERVDLSRTIGWFTSLFPIALDGSGTQEEGLKRVKEALRALPNKGVGFGAFKYHGSDSEKSALSQLPKAQLLFNYLGQMDSGFDSEGLLSVAKESTGNTVGSNRPNGHAIEINGGILGGELTLNIRYSPAEFTDNNVATFGNLLADGLRQLIVHCTSGAKGLTPSDVPLSKLTQVELDALPLVLGNIEDIYPLSPMQQGMLFHSLYEPEGSAYLNQLRLDITDLDESKFKDAWQHIGNRHSVLRTGFLTEREVPLQYVERVVDLPWILEDWNGCENSDEENNTKLDALAKTELSRGLALNQAGLSRVVVIRLDENTHHLIWTNHHILSDGWSLSRQMGEVLMAYEGHQLPPVQGQYRDYIAWLESRNHEDNLAYWNEQVEQLDSATYLTAALPVSDEVGHKEFALTLTGVQTQSLQTFSQQHRITVNTLVQGAWSLLLSRYSGQRTVCFGATTSGRPTDLANAEETLGMFINTIPVINEIKPESTIGDWLKELQLINLSNREHEYTALSDIQKMAEKSVGLGQSGLFDNIIVFENYPISETLKELVPGKTQFSIRGNREETNFSLVLGLSLGKQLEAKFSYISSEISSTAVETIARQLTGLLESMIQDGDTKLFHFDALLPEQREGLMAQAESTAMPHLPMIERIVSMGRADLDKAAVIEGDTTLSYRELEEQSNRLAHYLIEQGVLPEMRVGIALPRSVSLLTAYLAVLKSGAVYVPLDLSYPENRLAYLVADSNMTHIIGHSDEPFTFADGVQHHNLQSVVLADQYSISDVFNVKIAAENAAYIIYTSGSTGQPKGVVVSRGAIAMHCEGIGKRYGMSSSSREMIFMSFSFDGAHERWATALSYGGTVVMRGEALWTVEETYNMLHHYAISEVTFPPVYLQQLAEHVDAVGNPPPVRTYCFGGEAMSREGFDLARRALKPYQFINGYGPTETVVTPLLWRATPQTEIAEGYAPIGTPVGDRTAYVLNPDLSMALPGVIGELYLGGELGLARGYLNRPDLTAERFIANPFSAADSCQGERLYRTGDLVRWNVDGQLEYMSRIDNQVKIRGFRIELGEIESQLLAQPGVREAVVVADEGQGVSRLVAYVSLAIDGDQHVTLTSSEIKALLSNTLPDYMVPSVVMVLDALPLNNNGKVDRNALPKAVFESSRDYIAPEGEEEIAIAGIWQEVLSVARVGRYDNFFELGGDSLLSLKVINKIRNCELIPLVPSLRDLMLKPTIADLMSINDAGKSNAIGKGALVTASPLMPLNTIDSELPNVFFVHAVFGTVFDYNNLAKSLAGQYSVWGIQSRMLINPQWSDSSLEQMATDYVECMRQKQPKGPYRLLGWSLGGGLAVMMTAILEQQGERVEWLGLVDSYVPKPFDAVQLAAFKEGQARELVNFINLNFPTLPRADLPPMLIDALEMDVELDRGQSQSILQEVIEFCNANNLTSSGFGAVELAHVFLITWHLKQLSVRVSRLPKVNVAPFSWWINERRDESELLEQQIGKECAQKHFVGDDHFMILDERAFITGLQDCLEVNESV
ncbi:hypothetical protein A9Q81_17430 [Gammaproteobacteria bacterium 42_54_T18]|nr:hypothetical protein A9Q81_17430 [Gammaproteobacteria bacterium 42_54_T18]